MTLASLQINHFRNLATVDFIPSSGMNIICGNNGSGKTSLLEAIYYLGVGRSFRTPLSSRLIQHANDKFSIFSQLVSHSNRQIAIGMERETSGNKRLRIAERDVSSMSELASYLPLRVINSYSHQLFEAGPAYRRKFLDWGLFYLSENFISYWRDFERALKQRNMILSKHRSRNELKVWTKELVRHGLILDSLRRDYLAAFTPLFIEVVHELLNVVSLEITYEAGWHSDMDFATVLEKGYAQECRYGYTQFGPHRADLTLTINHLPVKHFLSRGQQKLLICAMMIAQGKLLLQRTNQKLVYLIDDLPSELDLLSRQKLISLLTQQHTQVFITAIESDAIYHLMSAHSVVPIKVFHVEHGRIVEMTHLKRP